MKRMTPGQISETFNATHKGYAAAARKYGFGPLLEDISSAVGDLRDAGIDVSMDVVGDAGQMAFSLFNAGATIAATGIIHIGGIERLFTIATRVGSEDTLQLALSAFDIRFEGTHGKLAEGSGSIVNNVSSKIFDFRKDPDALVKFQKELIDYAARNRALKDFDKGQAFGDGALLNKLKINPPKAA